MGLEVCATLGMLNSEQARQLKEAGLTAYNHNLDTSPEYYPKVRPLPSCPFSLPPHASRLLPPFRPQVITTRSYEDRLQTIANVRDAGISVCSGGILGLGEQHADRIGLLHTLATLPEHPESVPINALGQSPLASRLSPRPTSTACLPWIVAGRHMNE
jgi:biotin synthase